MSEEEEVEEIRQKLHVVRSEGPGFPKVQVAVEGAWGLIWILSTVLDQVAESHSRDQVEVLRWIVCGLDVRTGGHRTQYLARPPNDSYRHH